MPSSPPQAPIDAIITPRNRRLPSQAQRFRRSPPRLGRALWRDQRARGKGIIVKLNKELGIKLKFMSTKTNELRSPPIN